MARDVLDERQGVLHPMIELVDQQAHLCL